MLAFWDFGNAICWVFYFYNKIFHCNNLKDGPFESLKFRLLETQYTMNGTSLPKSWTLLVVPIF